MADCLVLTHYTVSDTDCSLPYPGETMVGRLVLTQYTVSDTDCSLPYPSPRWGGGGGGKGPPCGFSQIAPEVLIISL